MSSQELILAQEQSVVAKIDSFKQLQGTLVLTNQRLLFVCANQDEEIDWERGGNTPKASDTFKRRLADLRFADVEDLSNIPPNPRNISIPLSALGLEKGHSGILGMPNLKVKWKEMNVERKVEFVEEIADSHRKRSLKDWARVIDQLKSGKISLHVPQSPYPQKDSLEGRILSVLGDMQDKGVLEIEQQVESKFGVDLDPDEVNSACDRLVLHGFLDLKEDSSGDDFYRKKSPLGEDDLSS